MFWYFRGLYVEKNNNKNVSIGVQIIDKTSGKQRVKHLFGSSYDPSEVEYLWKKNYSMIKK